MKRKYLIISILVLGFVFVFAENNSAQQISKTKLELRAKHNFSNGNYELALTDFRLLYNTYPKHEEYCFFLGRCFLNTNRELEFAVELLKYSAIRGERNEAHYYLGELYKKLYRLDDAIISYTTFINGASKNDLKNLNAEHQKVCAEKMTHATKQGMKLNMIDKEEFHEVAFEKGYEGNIEGTIIHKPDEFALKTDKEFSYDGLMYVPEKLDEGRYIYFSGYDDNGNNKQIFRVKKISEKEYSMPEPLSEIINTKEDEEFPFFDELSSTLYFASKGHCSFGGYDIFKSHYNYITNTWEQPEQLDFPVNTPFDDYMYVINNKEDIAVFTSNRESKTKKLTVYAYKLEAEPVFARLESSNDKINFSKLELSGSQSNTDSPDNKDLSSYDELISEALGYQAKADSFLLRSREKRGILISTADDTKRRKISSEIYALDTEYKKAQNKANDLFEQANNVKEMEDRNTLMAQSNENITLKEEQDDVKVYEYVVSTASATASSTAASQPVKSEKLIVNHTQDDKKIKRKDFEILSSSPYNNTNPIPKNTELPEGLVYRIQLGAFSDDISASAFKGLSPVSAEKLMNSNVTKYYVGYFSSSTDARSALERVKEYGYPDAFLVPYYNQEKISIIKAGQIELDQNKL